MPPTLQRNRTASCSSFSASSILLAAAALRLFRNEEAAAAPDKVATKAAAKHKKPKIGIVNFEPFVVNLADAGGRRFLRINVRLIVDDLEKAEQIQKSEVQLMRLA
jgi:flagellar basal body-associated protein FliL